MKGLTLCLLVVAVTVSAVLSAPRGGGRLGPGQRGGPRRGGPGERPTGDHEHPTGHGGMHRERPTGHRGGDHEHPTGHGGMDHERPTGHKMRSRPEPCVDDQCDDGFCCITGRDGSTKVCVSIGQEGDRCDPSGQRGCGCDASANLVCQSSSEDTDDNDGFRRRKSAGTCTAGDA